MKGELSKQELDRYIVNLLKEQSLRVIATCSENVPEYRKKLFEQDEVRERAGDLIKEICGEYGIDIGGIEVAKDHVHMLVSFQPKLSIGDVVRIIKT
jgi:hypothetical protein